MSATGGKSSLTAASAGGGGGGGSNNGGSGSRTLSKGSGGAGNGGGVGGKEEPETVGAAAAATATTGNLPGSVSKKASRRAAASTTGVMDYLQTCLPKSVLLQLYTEEARGRFVCRAVLQRLSAQAKQVVLRLSSTGGKFPLQGVQVWTHSPNPVKTTDRILKELHKWAIIHNDYQPANNNNSNNKTGGGSSNTAAAGGGRKRKAGGDDDDAEDDDEAAAAAAASTTKQQPPAATHKQQQQQQIVTLTDEFRTGLQAALLHLDASPWVPITQEQIAELEREEKVKPSKPVTPEDLERHTQQQWDAVLHFLVGTSGKPEPPSAVVQFLLQTGLMQVDPEFRGSDPSNADMDITEKGYDFMLQDNHQQVWHFVVQYLQSLEAYEKKGPKLVREALLLLICLSFARVGEAYLTSTSINKNGRKMIQDLAHFGLLLTRKIGKEVTLFYPTRVAMQLVGNEEAERSASALWSLSTKALESALSKPNPQNSSHLAIIVQTNFQVCAYTTSELHVSMLGLFCDVNTIRRLPNVVFLTITRDSVKGAFALGIQARQILRFLEKHAHPKLRVPPASGVPINPRSPLSAVPGNVEDQIWLWDREQTRVQFTEVYRHQCLMPGEFKAVVEFAETRIGKNCHAWSSVQTQVILIDYRHVERVQNYVRQWRAKRAAAGAAG